MDTVAAQDLRDEGRHVALLYELAPEVVVLPTAIDMCIAAHVLPGAARHQGHGVNVIAVPQPVRLPDISGSDGVLAAEQLDLGISSRSAAGCNGLMEPANGTGIDFVIGIDYENMASKGMGKGGVAGLRQTLIAPMTQQ